MWQKLWRKLQTTIFGGAIIVGSSWILSKILGLVRERLIANAFGTAGADPIYAAFTIPDFIYGTLVLGSLLTAFIPVFIAYRQRDEAEAWRISRSILNIIVLVFTTLGLILLIFAGPIIGLLVGDKFGAAAQATSVLLLRIMSMNMLLFAVSNVFAGILQAHKQFFAISIAPILNNLGTIAGLLWLVPTLGPAGVAWGAVAGALLHTGIQAHGAWRLGWRPGHGVARGHDGVKQIGRLLLPRTIGQSVTQIDQLVNVPIATRIGPANLTIFRRANVLQDFPSSIVGVSLATVAFPVFVELLSQNRREEFVKHFSQIVRQIMFIIIPMTVLFIQLRAQLVRLAFGSDKVSWPDTIASAQTLGFFALSFFAQALIPVLARSFYAMQDTKTPVRITSVAVGLDIVGSIFLGSVMGVTGLALSFTISSILNAGWLFVVLHKRMGQLDELRMFSSTLKILGVTILMALCVQAAKMVAVGFGADLNTGLGVFVQTLTAGGVGVVAFVLLAALFKLDEASLIRTAIERFWQLVKNGNGQTTTPTG
ncbi:MAG: murein biosynthesis integral membrane protein MurJ [Candidatus Kerfeldbacteria bacterium]|nr:murein biosynthesis integral membrane protein MurJ [Candidatus Kerfeldbacteria bacterium]